MSSESGIVTGDRPEEREPKKAPFLASVRLGAIEKRCEVARPGPWRPQETPIDSRYSTCSIAGRDGYLVAGEFTSLDLADADFIAHAREDVPWLLARVRELEAQKALAIEVGEGVAGEIVTRAPELKAERDRLKAQLEKLDHNHGCGECATEVGMGEYWSSALCGGHADDLKEQVRKLEAVARVRVLGLRAERIVQVQAAALYGACQDCAEEGEVECDHVAANAREGMCVNGCDAPIAPPSKVICQGCLDKITRKLERLAAGKPLEERDQLKADRIRERVARQEGS